MDFNYWWNTTVFELFAKLSSEAMQSISHNFNQASIFNRLEVIQFTLSRSTDSIMNKPNGEYVFKRLFVYDEDKNEFLIGINIKNVGIEKDIENKLIANDINKSIIRVFINVE